MLLDQFLDRRHLEVADRDDGHQVRPIPVGVELLETVVVEVVDDVHAADGDARGVPRSFHEDRELHVLHPRVRAAAEAPFLADDTALLVDLGRIEREVVRPVFEREECLVDHVGPVGRDLQDVDGLVEAGEGVHARAHPHADGLHELHQLVLREMRRAVKRHVLDEVRQPPLVLVFEHGPGLDDQAQFGAVLRLVVGANVIVEAVGERADGDVRIDGDYLIERGGLRVLRQRRVLHLRVRQAQHSGDKRDGQHGACLPTNSHLALLILLGHQAGDVAVRRHLKRPTDRTGLQTRVQTRPNSADVRPAEPPPALRRTGQQSCRGCRKGRIRLKQMCNEVGICIIRRSRTRREFPPDALGF